MLSCMKCSWAHSNVQNKELRTFRYRFHFLHLFLIRLPYFKAIWDGETCENVFVVKNMNIHVFVCKIFEKAVTMIISRLCLMAEEQNLRHLAIRTTNRTFKELLICSHYFIHSSWIIWPRWWRQQRDLSEHLEFFSTSRYVTSHNT